MDITIQVHAMALMIRSNPGDILGDVLLFGWSWDAEPTKGLFDKRHNENKHGVVGMTSIRPRRYSAHRSGEWFGTRRT
jgi:hypothetical protein